MKETKDLFVKNNGKGLYTVHYQGGGELPKELTGLYTSVTQAEKAIHVYQATKKKIKSDGSSTSKQEL